MYKRTYCKWCGKLLSPTHTGPCPYCGQTGIKTEVIIRDSINLRDAINLEKRREFYEENRLIKWFLYLLNFGSPFLGYFVAGSVGFVIGLFISIISYLLGPYAVIKVREIIRENA